MSLRFTSAQPPNTVFAYFEKTAAAAGWVPGNRNVLGYPQTWSKTYPNRVPGWLSLIEVQRPSGGGAATYVLSASSPAAQ